MNSFRALLLEDRDGRTEAAVKELNRNELPDGDVLVAVTYSCLNYKDAMAVTGTGKIVRSWPMVPGIDFAGVVVESASADYASGDEVVLTGWGVGERHWGGYAGLARVKSDWLVRKPEGLTLRQTMQLGTAGFTAMLCVSALQHEGVAPAAGSVLVTGASGGVGGAATAILGRLGYTVAASTGREDNREYLQRLGAAEIIGRDDVKGPLGKPLESQRWAGAVDTVGGETLAELLKSIEYGGAVSACGLTGGADVCTTVYPFILRGVKLIGIDSGMCPLSRRTETWGRLAELFDSVILDELTAAEISLEDVPLWADKLIQGKIRGRVLVKL